MQKYLMMLLLFFVSLNSYGQYKYEREVRVREEAVPAMARDFVDAMQFNRNVRWYKEFGEHRISFEAKTRYRGERYSIEFSSDGVFEDLEIEIAPEDIPAGVFSKIEAYLQAEFERYDIEKVQLQLSGDADLIRDHFRQRAVLEGVDRHYEIVVSARPDGSFRLFEYLFTEAGDFVRKATIREKSIDNIIY